MAHKSLTKEIAKKLDAGMICYIHKQTRKITTIEDLEEGVTPTAEWEATFQNLEKNIRDYMKVPRMSDAEMMHVREDFIREPVSHEIKKELSKAMKRNNPVRNFTQIIEAHEDIEYYWLSFKADWYQQWVEGYLLDIYKY